MIIIPDLFTPYLSGVEMARKANWDDLQNYNQVQKGQLDNLFDFATFSPKVNSEYENTDKLALSNLFQELTFNNALTKEQVAANKALLENLLAQHVYQQYMGGVQTPTNPQVPGTTQVQTNTPSVPNVPSPSTPTTAQTGTQSPTSSPATGVPNITVSPPAPQQSASTRVRDWVYSWLDKNDQPVVPNWMQIRP